MAFLPLGVNVYLYTRPTDMRKSYTGLVALTTNIMLINTRLMMWVGGINLDERPQNKRFQCKRPLISVVDSELLAVQL